MGALGCNHLVSEPFPVYTGTRLRVAIALITQNFRFHGPVHSSDTDSLTGQFSQLFDSPYDEKLLDKEQAGTLPLSYRGM